MSYDYKKLLEKIIEVIGADASVTQRMLAVIEECSRQKPHPDWDVFSDIDFEADALAIHDWLSSAFGNPEQQHCMRGLWFGLVNLSDGCNTTSDIYVGGSPDFDNSAIDWISEIFAITECNYLNSRVLHEIYAKAYRDGSGALGNHAEYPLALAYGAIVAVQTFREDGLLASNLASLRGAAAGFDSGDFLFLGSIEQGRFYPNIKTG
ncbi:hypothetical protein [Massilia sp. BJB1822]|uniref:hypothetical protein n=1 Tax=Massilia sp. BJB1822 TaxID=2744470 RepID=UPI001593725C|nr:hypothetical protein [Massilia sp. BJB1822]NVE01740.1 hypothetical protein [Massilia sp. BJB1822]